MQRVSVNRLPDRRPRQRYLAVPRPDHVPPISLWWDIAGAKTRLALRDTYNFFIRQLARIGILLAPMEPPKPVQREMAVWHITAAKPGDYLLKIHYGGQVYDKDLLVGQRYYSAQSNT